MSEANRIKRRVDSTVREYINVANKHYKKDFHGRSFKVPTVEYRIPTHFDAAGFARQHENLIVLHPILLVENEGSYIKRTIPHEVAHLISQLNTRRYIESHGEEWLEVMDVFEVEDNSRHHDYTLKNVIPGNDVFKYVCSCHDWYYSKSEHAHHKKKNKNSYCPRCSHDITYVKKVKKDKVRIDLT